MAHMDRMIILHLWGMRERRILKSAREYIASKAPREPIDAMRQWGKKRLSELLYARARLKCLFLSIPKHT